jgi:hypothetical protein
MKSNGYNYYQSGKASSVNEDNFAFANQRMNDKLRQAETARRVKATTEMIASSKSKVILQWVAAALAWIS